METYRSLQRLRGLDYLQTGDRFISAQAEPEYRFAVIGCGMMGLEHMYNTLLEGRASVAGIYDTEPSSIQHAQQKLERWGVQPRVYASLAEAIADPDTDALLIATPNHTHLQVVREVAGCAKALFLEKPIATRVDDAMEITRLLAAHPHYVQIGLQYRYKAPYREAIHEALVRGTLGPIHNVSMQEHRFPFLDKVGQWNKFNKNTGGTLLEKCCHYFDLINLFAGGEPKKVVALGRHAVNFHDFARDGESADGLDHAQVLIDYDNGVTGHFSLNMFTAGSREELVVNGERGRLQAVEQSRFGEQTENVLDIWAHDHASSRRVEPGYAKHIADAGHHGSTFYEHVAFVDGLSGAQSLEFAPATLVDAVWSVLVATAAQQSIERGEPVEIATLRPAELPGMQRGTGLAPTTPTKTRNGASE